MLVDFSDWLCVCVKLYPYVCVHTLLSESWQTNGNPNHASETHPSTIHRDEGIYFQTSLQMCVIIYAIRLNRISINISTLIYIFNGTHSSSGSSGTLTTINRDSVVTTWPQYATLPSANIPKMTLQLKWTGSIRG